MRQPVLFLIVVLLLALLAPLAVGAASNPQAVVTLAADQTAFGADQSVLVRVTIANPTGQPVKLLRWLTPAEDVEGPLFVVTRDGAAVPYIGAYYKRPEPKAEDYITLKAGASLTRVVDLAAYYDLSASGSYSVRYAVAAADLYAEKETGPAKAVDSLASKELQLWIEGRQIAEPAVVEPDAVTGPTSFNKCTTAQQTDLIAARNQASTYLVNANGYLAAGTTGPRYITWFGTYTASRYNTVKSNFTKIGSAMDTASVTFDCGCKKQYYAYVYPTQPYKIYLCRVFWTAPLAGTDSKAGTLIHEMSHFNVVAGTDDFVYGQSGAKNLAITNPDQAIANADNHEYFSENTPFQN